MTPQQNSLKVKQSLCSMFFTIALEQQQQLEAALKR